MHSGDLATMDEDGYVNIVGRLKDMIIRGGENVYPREIEEFLFTHPDVADVQVIGVPDERFGEVIMAWVQLEAGAERMPLDANPATAHMFIINPLHGGSVDNLFSTHPKTQNRVQELEKLAGLNDETNSSPRRGHWAW